MATELPDLQIITIGKYTISTYPDGGYWIRHESGEGMQTSAQALEDCIRKFYDAMF